jgi:hypothetical protein
MMQKSPPGSNGSLFKGLIRILVLVTRAREVVAAAQTTYAAAMLAAETSAREAAATRDNAALRVKDAEDRAALAEREALERVSRAAAENAVALASAREDTKGLARTVPFLEDELVAERQAQEVFEREHQEQCEEITFLQTRCSEVCHAIIGPPRMKYHLSEGMQIVTLRYVEMTGEFAMLRATVTTTAESVLEHSPSDTFLVEVVGELATEY